MELWSANIITYLLEINVKIQIEFRCLNQVSLLLYGKYMEDHSMLEPIDKHIP